MALFWGRQRSQDTLNHEGTLLQIIMTLTYLRSCAFTLSEDFESQRLHMGR